MSRVRRPPKLRPLGALLLIAALLAVGYLVDAVRGDADPAPRPTPTVTGVAPTP